MGLEAATYISQLVNTNPVSGDGTAQGDDHLRLIKAVLQATIPNASRAFYIAAGAAKTANYSVVVADEAKYFFANATGGTFDFELPVVGLFSGFAIKVMKTDGSANAVTLTPTSGTINGAASLSLGSEFAGATIIWTGSTWIALRFFSNSISGDVTLLDDLTVQGETIFEDIVTFEQGVEMQGPVDALGAFDFQAEADFGSIFKLLGQTLVDGANVAWNMALQPIATLTAAGNRTIDAPTGEAAGQIVFLKYIQDPVGNRVPTFDASYKGPGGSAVQRPGLTANEVTIYFGLVQGANDVILIRLYTSLHKTPNIFNDIDLGSFAANTTFSHSHNFGYVPKVEFFLKITTAEFGYSVGDYIPTCDVADDDTSPRALTTRVNTTLAALKVFTASGIIQRFNADNTIDLGSLATAPKVILRLWE